MTDPEGRSTPAGGRRKAPVRVPGERRPSLITCTLTESAPGHGGCGPVRRFGPGFPARRSRQPGCHCLRAFPRRSTQAAQVVGVVREPQIPFYVPVGQVGVDLQHDGLLRREQTGPPQPQFSRASAACLTVTKYGRVAFSSWTTAVPARRAHGVWTGRPAAALPARRGCRPCGSTAFRSAARRDPLEERDWRQGSAGTVPDVRGRACRNP